MKKQLFSFAAIWLCYMLCIASTQAQNKKVLIIDDSHNGIPYICLKSLSTNHYLLSDVDGYITLNDGQFMISDTLQVESLFFENLKMQVKDFIKRDSVTLHNRNFAMDEVSVYSSGSLKEILEKLSRNFAEKYAKDYAAQMLHLRTVEANGKYREFCGYQGIFASYNFTQTPVQFSWEDKNKMYAAPLTVMRSDPLMSNKDEKINTYAVYGKGNIDMRSKDYLKIGYLNVACHDPLEYKRSVEMYTPLNHRQISNFNYTIADEYVNAVNQRIIVIRFSTKPKAYPGKTVISGIGYLYYNSELEYVERIVMENHQDQYSIFPRWKLKTLVNSATKHILDIAYCMYDGHIYTRSISLDVQWLDPNTEKEFYYIKVNSRRNPIKYNLHEYETVLFSGFVFLDKEKKKKIEPFLPYPAIDYMLVYVAAFDKTKWDNILLPGVDRVKLFKDLNLKNRPLFTQAQENALDIDYYRPLLNPQTKKILLHYYIQTREKLYPILYHEKYH